MIADIVDAIKLIGKVLDGEKTGTDILHRTFNTDSYYRNSIASKAKQNTCQFPLLLSGNVSVKAASKISVMMEQMFANYIRMVIINSSEIIDLTKNENKMTFINKIHQNDNFNYGLTTTVNSISNISQELDFSKGGKAIDKRESDEKRANEATRFPFALNESISKDAFLKANIELNKPYIDNFNLEYMTPKETLLLSEDYYDDDYTSGMKILASIAGEIQKLNEELNKLNGKKIELREIKHNLEHEARELAGLKIKAKKRKDFDEVNRLSDEETRCRYELDQTNHEIEIIDERIKAINVILKQYEDKEKRLINKGNLAVKYETSREKRLNTNRRISSIRTDGTIRKNNEAEPTILELDLIYNNGTGMSSAKLALGVKTITHVIPYEEMVYFIAHSLEEDNTLFKFLKWTTGEIKFLKDLVLDFNNVKMQALSDKASLKWARHLIHRGKEAKVRKFLNKDGFVPNTTIILSREDVEFMKLRYNIDLFKNRTAASVCNLFFLLHLIIVDEIDDILYIFNMDVKTYERYSFEKLQNEILSMSKVSNNYNRR